MYLYYTSYWVLFCFSLLIFPSECSDNEMGFRENCAFIQEMVSMLTQPLIVLYILKVITGQLIGNELWNAPLFMSQLSSSARMASSRFLLSPQTYCFRLLQSHRIKYWVDKKCVKWTRSVLLVSSSINQRVWTGGLASLREDTHYGDCLQGQLSAGVTGEIRQALLQVQSVHLLLQRAWEREREIQMASQSQAKWDVNESWDLNGTSDIILDSWTVIYQK